jgi:hypothetical protein
MTAKRPTPEGEVTHTHTSPPLPSYSTKESKAPEIFKLTTLCNIVIKAPAYTSQNGLTQCHNRQRFCHIWVHCRRPPRCLWCGGGHRHRECPEKQKSECVPTCCNCDLQEGESPHPESYKGCSHAEQKISKYTTPDRSFAAALRSSDQ